MKPLWSPSPDDIKNSILSRFCAHVGMDNADFDALHRWSVERASDFWMAVWDFCGVIGDRGGEIISAIDGVPYARFFLDSKISYAENMLARCLVEPDAPAILFRRQDKSDRIISGAELCGEVSRWEQALAGQGVGEGDAVVVYLPNIPETVFVLLAASNLGAVFASAGMEMGGDDLVNRFSQIQPKVLVTQEGYVHGAKEISRTDVIARAGREIGSLEYIILHNTKPSSEAVEEIRGKIEEGGVKKGEQEGGGGIVIEAMRHCEHREAIQPTEDGLLRDARNDLEVVGLEDLLSGYEAKALEFVRRDFNWPLYVLFSSGSTGAPKCFEHSSGGVLLKHLVEYQLHCDVNPGDRMFYHATPSWMMWNWLVSGLASGATILMYDGNPFYPNDASQWYFTAAHRCTHFGTAAPVILAWEAADLDILGIEMPDLRMVLSTGAVLPEQSYRYIHAHLKADVKVASISGGTDLVGCFLGGNPFAATYEGQVDGAILGCDIQVWDDEGGVVRDGDAGELVCVNAFPSMPLRFLNDDGGARYEGEYFSHYEGRKVWRHGDTVRKTEDGQYVIVGRSDATLNQNGVRIGPAVIYDQVARFGDEIARCAAVDFTRLDNSQALTVLFLVMVEGVELSEDLVGRIKKAVKDNVTPYAVPSEIILVPDVLRTPNGKVAEVVMKKILAGEKVVNASLYGVELVDRFAGIGRELKAKYGE